MFLQGIMAIRWHGGAMPGWRSQVSVVDTEKIESGEEQRTTLMIRNIPNRYVFKITAFPRQVTTAYFISCTIIY